MSVVDTAELGPGAVFEEHFRIDTVLGQGGFSVVYGATDLRHRRAVAIKLLKANFQTDAELRSRVAREADIAAQLSDPHNVLLYEHGATVDGRPFLVFEDVGGRDLSEILHESGHLDAVIVEGVLRQLLTALGEAHRLGILHRDLKPENIRVQGDWRVKLLDYGIARPTSAEHPRLTATGELIGTPRYMSPEQLTDRTLTPASDIYSLGIVAFEMLVGRDALHGNRWNDQLERLQTGHLLSAPGFGDHGALTAVIQRMTARAAKDRFQTIQQVVAALDGETAPQQATTNSSNKPPLLGALLLGVGLVIIAAVAFRLWDEPKITQAPLPPRLPPPFIKPVAAPVERVETDAGEGDAETDSGPVAFACHGPPPFVGLDFLDQPVEKRPWAYIPISWNPETPTALIILIGEHQTPPETLIKDGGFKELAEKHAFIIVAPRDQSWNIRKFSSRDDIEDITRAQEAVKERLCIDPDRVFVVTQGRGSRAGRHLACADWVTAIAANTGRHASGYDHCDKWAADHASTASKSFPKPFLDLSPRHSTVDPMEGGARCAGERSISHAEMLKTLWQRNDCKRSRGVVSRPAHMECTTWECRTPFESCLVEGGGRWPNTGEGFCNDTSTQADLAGHVWEFFSRVAPAPR